MENVIPPDANPPALLGRAKAYFLPSSLLFYAIAVWVSGLDQSLDLSWFRPRHPLPSRLIPAEVVSELWDQYTLSLHSFRPLPFFSCNKNRVFVY